MKLLSRLLLLSLFSIGISACAPTPPASNGYAVGNPPKPRLDAKAELEQGQYQHKR